MPSWAIHLAITTKINKKINMNKQDKNIFLLGNILPDILNGYLIKNISHIVSHKQTHIQKKVQIGNHKEYRYDIEGFYEKYNNRFSNPLILGYYTHIFTDFYWNNLTYSGKGIFDDEKNLIGLQLNNGKKLLGKMDDLRKTKTSDFKIFANYIYQNKLTEVPYYDEKMLEYAKELIWLDLQKEDIIEAITYLENMATLQDTIQIEDNNYQIFSEEEMKQNLEKCVKEILNKIDIKE